jgi:Ser/Thr protein kinase RdoA (MazF antagonist)
MSTAEPFSAGFTPVCPICGRGIDRMAISRTGEFIGCEECARSRGLTTEVITPAEWMAHEAVRDALAHYGLTDYTATKPEHMPGRPPRAHLWDISANGERYLLRRFYPWLDVSAIHFEHSVLAHLRARGLPVALPVADGATFVETDGGRWALYPLLDGQQVSKQDWMWRVPKAAEILATLHVALEQFQPEGAPHPSWDAWTLASVDEMVARWPERPEIPADLVASVRARLAERYFNDIYARLPRTVVHGDFGLASVLWQGDGVSGIVNFERTHPDTPLFDFGRGIGMRWPPLMRAVVATYTRVRPLSPLEREALPEALLLGMLGGIDDELANSADPQELARRGQDLFFLLRDAEALRKAVAAK